MGKSCESKSEFYEDRLFIINKKLLEILGRWPYQAKRSRILLLSLYFVGILTVVVAELIYFVRVIRMKDIRKIIDCLPALIFTYGAMVMIFNSMIKFVEMRQILGRIEENWLSVRHAEEYAVLKEYAEEGRFLIIGYTLCIIGSLATYSLEPLVPQILDKISPLNESRPIKTFLEVEYLVDHRRYYTAIYLHNMQAAFWVIFTVLAIDAYLVMIVQHACSMFVVLGYVWERRLDNSETASRILNCVELRGFQDENRENRLGLAGEYRERANHRVRQAPQELHRLRRADRVFVHGLAVPATLSQHGRDKRDGGSDHKPQGPARGDAEVLAEQRVGDNAALLHLVARPEDDRPQPPRARASVQRRLVRAADGLEEASAADAAQELEGLQHHGRRHVPHEFRDLLHAHADFHVLLYHDSVDAVNFRSMYANKV